MQVALPPELAELVAEELRSGRHKSAEEVVCEGLRLLKERNEQVANLRVDIQVGFEAIARGEYEEWDEASTRELAADIKRRGRERLAAGKRKTGTG